MFVYTEKSARRTPTPWGMEVKKRLIDRNQMQQDLINELVDNGFKVNKIEFSNLLYGIGVSVRTEEINKINEILNIQTDATQ